MYPHSPAIRKIFSASCFYLGLGRESRKASIVQSQIVPFQPLHKSGNELQEVFSLWRGQQIYQLLGKLIPVVSLPGELKKVPNELQGVDAGSEPAPLPVKPRQEAGTTSGPSTS